MKTETSTVLILGAVTAAAAAIYYAVGKVKEGADKAADVLAAPIADAYIAATLPGAVVATTSVRLPNGQVISFQDIRLNGDLTFMYQYVTYKVIKRGADNIYVAERVG